MFAVSRTRVSDHSPDHVNEAILNEIEDNIDYYASTGRGDLNQRLKELDYEWDIERALEANASVLALAGLTLGATVDRRWFAFPAVIAGFLLQHALQGWCPPVSVFRRMGIRTRNEIDYERYALKMIRGDFEETPEPSPGSTRTKAEEVLHDIRK
ncbi:MAG: hypothetical protein ACOCWY_03900 [Thermodesulfobacteriota bacterium]